MYYYFPASNIRMLTSPATRRDLLTPWPRERLIPDSRYLPTGAANCCSFLRQSTSLGQGGPDGGSVLQHLVMLAFAAKSPARGVWHNTCMKACRYEHKAPVACYVTWVAAAKAVYRRGTAGGFDDSSGRCSRQRAGTGVESAFTLVRPGTAGFGVGRAIPTAARGWRC